MNIFIKISLCEKYNVIISNDMTSNVCEYHYKWSDKSYSCPLTDIIEYLNFSHKNLKTIHIERSLWYDLGSHPEVREFRKNVPLKLMDIFEDLFQCKIKII